ncbi:MAG: hypothetical protein AAGH89_02520 [Verrucomicrobiota bacterium]
MMPTLLSDLAGNNTYVVELVILVLILIAIFALLFLNEESDEPESPHSDEADPSPQEEEKVDSPGEAEEAKAEPKQDPVEASGLSKLSNTRSDKELGLIFESAPELIDDLTKISGVGDVLCGKLNEFGIYRFEQIAAWDEAIIAEFSKRLSFKGRVEREKWVEQAGKLAGEERKN